MKKNNAATHTGRKKKNNITRIVLDLLIIACLLGAAYFYFEPKIRSKRQAEAEANTMDEFDNLLDSDDLANELTKALDKDVKPVPGEGYDFYGDELDVPEPERDAYGNVILHYEGKITIPRVKIKTLLAADDSLHALRLSAGRTQSSAPIGEAGLSLIFGHNFHDRGRVFSRLDEVEVGDTIYMDMLKGRKRYVYKVYNVEWIDVEDLETKLSEKKTDDEMVFITCSDEYRNGQAAYRLLVYSRLEKEIAIPRGNKLDHQPAQK